MNKQNKGWIKLNIQASIEYLKGINDFLEFSFSYSKNKNTIRCPCCRCNAIYYKTRDEVIGDLLKSRFQQNYEHWESHGESSSDSKCHNDDDFEDDANVLVL